MLHQLSQQPAGMGMKKPSWGLQHKMFHVKQKKTICASPSLNCRIANKQTKKFFGHFKALGFGVVCCSVYRLWKHASTFKLEASSPEMASTLLKVTEQGSVGFRLKSQFPYSSPVLSALLYSLVRFRRFQRIPKIWIAQWTPFHSYLSQLWPVEDCTLLLRNCRLRRIHERDRHWEGYTIILD